MSPQLQKVVEPVTLGEGPHWHHDEQALYFVSTYDHTVHKYDPAADKHTRAKLGKRHHFVVGVERKVLEVKWSGEDDGAEVIRTIAEVDQDHPDNRLNDAKADPKGRLFAGTMGGEYAPGKFHLKRGRLYRVERDGGVRRLEEHIDVSNGLCWDVRRRAFYFADSFEHALRRYDYDVDTGDISNPKIIFSLREHGLAGIPDGMTIDTDGNIWLANFDNHRVLKIDPVSGKLLEKIPLPALQVTSVTFGGQQLDQLFVTTACVDRGVEQKPPSGATFTLNDLGVRGHPNRSVNMN